MAQVLFYHVDRMHVGRGDNLIFEEFYPLGQKTTNGMEIIYEDNHIISVVKPPNILSQEDISKDPDMVNMLKDDAKIRYNKPGNVFIGLVHRLDRPVGGTMVFAKTSKGASRLSQQMREGTFHKGYFAVVQGILPQEGFLSNILVKDSAKNLVHEAKSENETANGKISVLKFQLLSSKENKSLVFVEPITGRTHQIRVQMALAGYPLIGDGRYGKMLSEINVSLWSSVVVIKHPTLDKILAFRSLPALTYPWSLWNLSHYDRAKSMLN